MMNVKILLMFLGLFCFTKLISAQELFLETGKNSTFFKYQNSQDEALKNLQATSNTYLSAGYRNKFFIEKLKFSIGLQYSNYGAVASDDRVGNYMAWDISYLEPGFSLDYKILSIKKAELYLKTGSSVGFFLQGTQILNDRVIDLKDEDDFNTTKVDVKFGSGFIYPASQSISLYLQYMYSNGFNQAKNGESLKLHNHQVGIGVLINISSDTENNNITS